MPEPRKKTVLFIDDDEDDYLLMRDIFSERCGVDLQWVKDGEQALDRLMRRGGFKDAARPFIILLDLNMPRLNGREVLRQIRANEELRTIPVTVLTNSINKEEAAAVYKLGANTFIRKPSGYKELQQFVETFHKYWFEYSISPSEN